MAAEIINLRRARKAKGRSDAALQADANRIKHGIGKTERQLAEAQRTQASRLIDGHKMSNRERDS